MAAQAKKDGAVSHPGGAEIDRLVGPIGALVMLFALPVVSQFVAYLCAGYHCNEFEFISTLINLEHDRHAYFHWPTFFSHLFPWPDQTSVVIFIGWLALQWALHIIVPGRTVLGHPTQDGGRRLYYKINGLACLVITLAVLFGSLHYGYFDSELLVREFSKILMTANIVAFTMSTWLYFKGVLLKQGMPTGNVIIDYFYGYEPNPRLFGIPTTDFKWLTESRALIGKKNALTMIDFTSENFGWMLGWGNLVWVEFVFAMPAWYAFTNPKDLNPFVAFGILGLWVLGYIIFAQANTQKHQFRTDPTKPIWGKTPEFLRTKRGTNLLLSGWWGIVRKANYTGDLIQAWCFPLPCLALSFIPYVYPIYLTVLLVHRQKRDDNFCLQKYGQDWIEYCKRVPARFVPGFY